jgi:hypothetical protein
VINDNPSSIRNTRKQMTTYQFRLLAAVCGIIGPVTLVSSFFINPAPPVDASVAQLAEFAHRHYSTIVLGGWLQGMGSLLIVIFALALVHLAGATHWFSGWLTLLAGANILMVSLVEITFYLGAVQGAASGDQASGLASDNLRRAVQHVFLIAPALLLPLGVVVACSRLLPLALAYLALALGAGLQILGLVGLFHMLQPVIDVVLIVQGVWFIAAAILLIARPAKVSEKMSAMKGDTQKTS